MALAVHFSITLLVVNNTSLVLRHFYFLPSLVIKIISVIRAEIGRVGAARLRSPQEEVWTHYLCSIRATAMHVVKFLDWTLMTIGRWRSLGFMVYI